MRPWLRIRPTVYKIFSISFKGSKELEGFKLRQDVPEYTEKGCQGTYTEHSESAYVLVLEQDLPRSPVTRLRSSNVKAGDGTDDCPLALAVISLTSCQPYYRF